MSAVESSKPERVDSKFQSAVPVSNGKLAMWLFLSTEMMFFAALIASYVVIRLAAGVWPSHETVHVIPAIGIANTVILLLSGVAVSLATKAAAGDKTGTAKRWLLIGLLLGSAFLGVKGYEYYTKYTHGLYPRGKRSLVYEQADINYMAGVSAEISDQIAQFAGRADDENHQELLLQIQSGMVGWTKQKVGASNDPLMQQMAMASLAHQIYPTEEDPKFAKYIADEKNELTEMQRSLDAELKSAEASLKTTQDSLRELSQADTKDTEAINATSKQAAELTTLISTNKKNSKPVNDRLSSIEEFGELQTGINEHHHLQLPVVIPSGNAWINTYYLLTGFHALHLIAGLVLLMIALFMRLDKSRLPFLENTNLYWHFVDFVWLLLLPLLYFV